MIFHFENQCSFFKYKSGLSTTEYVSVPKIKKKKDFQI